MSRALEKQMADVEDLRARIAAAESTDEIVRLAKACEDITRAVCGTVEMELERRRLDRAVERRRRERQRHALARLAAMPPASRAIN